MLWVYGRASVYLFTLISILNTWCTYLLKLCNTFLLQIISNAILTKFSSIDMKTNGMKTVMELKGELKLITATAETWVIWLRLFDAHNNGDLINPDTENTYRSDPKIKVPPIFREFFRPL